MENTELKKLIENALVLLEKKYSETKEDIIKTFIDEYTRVLSLLQNKSTKSIKLEKIKTFTRMYMETSSNYAQDFLYAMSKVEEAIKNKYKW
ncbi:hypothetical protein PV797_16870 [Clostridiaceae bacterium M8S5]|nr:hypothetical protein PV797_16870 [Clostridiaceae bacterium M8S5]